MVTGWNGNDDESNLYYCGEDGARVYGWQWLKIPDGWSDDNEAVSKYISNYGEYAFFISIRKVARRSIALQGHIGSLRSMIKCTVLILRGSCRWAGYW